MSKKKFHIFEGPTEHDRAYYRSTDSVCGTNYAALLWTGNTGHRLQRFNRRHSYNLTAEEFFTKEPKQLCKKCVKQALSTPAKFHIDLDDPKVQMLLLSVVKT